MTLLNTIITDEERQEVEDAVAHINRTLETGTIIVEHLVDFIDARMPDAQA